MKFDQEFWNVSWGRPYHRYNRQHEAVWKAILPYLKGKVLDLGCGSCFQYKDTDIDLTGVDFSESALIEANHNYPNGSYWLDDIRKIRLSDKSFDTVVMVGVLDYFDDWEDVLKEARRLTKGKIVATLYNGFQGHNWEQYPQLTGKWRLWQEQQ